MSINKIPLSVLWLQKSLANQLLLLIGFIIYLFIMICGSSASHMLYVFIYGFSFFLIDHFNLANLFLDVHVFILFYFFIICWNWPSSSDSSFLFVFSPEPLLGSSCIPLSGDSLLYPSGECVDIILISYFIS